MVPLGEAQGGGEQGGAALVAPRDDGVEQVALVAVEGEVADFVEDEQAGSDDEREVMEQELPAVESGEPGAQGTTRKVVGSGTSAASGKPDMSSRPKPPPATNGL